MALAFKPFADVVGQLEGYNSFAAHSQLALGELCMQILELHPSNEPTEQQIIASLLWISPMIGYFSLFNYFFQRDYPPVRVFRSVEEESWATRTMQECGQLFVHATNMSYQLVMWLIRRFEGEEENHEEKAFWQKEVLTLEDYAAAVDLVFIIQILKDEHVFDTEDSAMMGKIECLFKRVRFASNATTFASRRLQIAKATLSEF